MEHGEEGLRQATDGRTDLQYTSQPVLDFVKILLPRNLTKVKKKGGFPSLLGVFSLEGPLRCASSPQGGTYDFRSNQKQRWLLERNFLALFLLCQGPHLAQAALPPGAEKEPASYTYEAYRKNFRRWTCEPSEGATVPTATGGNLEA